nr:MAG TPA: hypothetical protein [Caudoviricetes sp.]
MLKIDLNKPVTWKQSLICSGISLGITVVYYGFIWLDYEYDIVDNTKEFVGNRINDVKRLFKKRG